MTDNSRFFATVASVSTDGITLLFDGDATPSRKKYKYNRSVTFRVGDRVKLFPYAGTYIVEYPINR